MYNIHIYIHTSVVGTYRLQPAEHPKLDYMPSSINRLTPNDPYMGHTAPLTSKCFILYIYSTNIGTEYFKHALYSPFFSLQNAVCFIMLTCLVSLLFTFYIQDVLKLKKNNSGAKGLIHAQINYFLNIIWIHTSHTKSCIKLTNSEGHSSVPHCSLVSLVWIWVMGPAAGYSRSMSVLNVKRIANHQNVWNDLLCLSRRPRLHLPELLLTPII